VLNSKQVIVLWWVVHPSYGVRIRVDTGFQISGFKPVLCSSKNLKMVNNASGNEKIFLHRQKPSHCFVTELLKNKFGCSVFLLRRIKWTVDASSKVQLLSVLRLPYLYHLAPLLRLLVHSATTAQQNGQIGGACLSW
jgi:hypothetical protein